MRNGAFWGVVLNDGEGASDVGFALAMLLAVLAQRPDIPRSVLGGAGLLLSPWAAFLMI
jgi:hypothetical protein